MDLFFAICQGLGLALAAGIGGLLAILLASVLAHVDVGWDLDGTDLEWFASEWFVAVLFALNAAVFLLVRARGAQGPAGGIVLAAVAALGAVLFAASLADETASWWPGLAAGGAVAAGAGVVGASILSGAAKRAEGAAGTLTLLLAGTGFILVLVALFVPPLSLAAAAGIAVLALGRRRRAQRKFEGLRLLR